MQRFSVVVGYARRCSLAAANISSSTIRRRVSSVADGQNKAEHEKGGGASVGDVEPQGKTRHPSHVRAALDQLGDVDPSEVCLGGALVFVVG